MAPHGEVDEVDDAGPVTRASQWARRQRPQRPSSDSNSESNSDSNSDTTTDTDSSTTTNAVADGDPRRRCSGRKVLIVSVRPRDILVKPQPTLPPPFDRATAESGRATSPTTPRYPYMRCLYAAGSECLEDFACSDDFPLFFLQIMHPVRTAWSTDNQQGQPTEPEDRPCGGEGGESEGAE
ncbi:hypothetical protein NPX13_g5871 [Xylaria arbuscula]|uniref:Uncharacterized protein n=1 Tax=Xylaria arbuscula TaxID=114810 RepID=A0A9W8NDL5_9PEZI|nr:hypothetical protein NPX13_g5871 [Xylaria arbuscula]